MYDLKGFAIWLIPDGKEFHLLKSYIQNLAVQYSTPPFDPHITLVGQIEVKEEDILCRIIPFINTTHTFKVELTNIAYHHDYYKCLFLKVKESEILLKIHAQAAKIFSIPEKEFMPHLSIMYGNLEKDEKDKITKEIDIMMPINLNIKFIRITSVNGTPMNWYTVREFSLD